MPPDSPSVLPAPGSPGAWLLAMRPATLTAAAAPVLVGTAVAVHSGTFRLLPGAVALLGAWLLQVASNFANDVFDYEQGADTEERLGPTRAVLAGLLSPAQVRVGLVVVLVLAVMCGTYLAVESGWVIVAIGIASIIAAIAYTGGPYPLGYHGLGDLFVLLFFGFVAVAGTTYVHLGELSITSLWSGLGVGALATNILVVNNLRDRETDALAGKRTLAVRWGRRAALAEYALCVVCALCVPPLLVLLGRAGPWVLLGCLAAPLLLRNLRSVVRLQGRALNGVLVSSARAVFVYSLFFSLGFIIDGLS